MSFKLRLPHELDHLDDEELIAYAVAARAAGEVDALANALAVLGYRRLPDLIRRALIKLPRDDAEDVAALAMSEAVLARFEGTSVGEFIVLMHTILARRIADFYKKGERTLDTQPLPEEHGADEDVHGPAAATAPDPTGAVDAQSVLDQAMAELSEQHRRVVELYALEDLSAEDAARQVNEEFPDANPEMSVNNVQQIKSRFIRRFRGLLGGDE